MCTPKRIKNDVIRMFNPLYPIRMHLGIVLKCIPQTFDYNLSSSRKRSIVNVGSFAVKAVKTAHLVPRRTKVGVYRD